MLTTAPVSSPYKTYKHPPFSLERQDKYSLFSLDYSRNVSLIIRCLSAWRAFSFLADVRKTIPVHWRTKDKGPLSRSILYLFFVALWPCNNWIAWQSWPHFKRRRMGSGSGGLMNGSNSFETHMVTINVTEEALSRFMSREPTLCVAGLQMLILSFAFFWSRVAQPLLRNCSSTHRQINPPDAGMSLSGTKVVDLDLLSPHYRHVSGVLVLSWITPGKPNEILWYI